MLDQKDKIMLENLFSNARLTTKELAREAGITQPAAFKRLQTLESQKYIDRYDSIINWQAFSFIKIVYLCNRVDIPKVKAQHCCFGIHEMIGEYRYTIWCFFKNRKMQREFEKMLPKDCYKIIIRTANWSGMSIFDVPINNKSENINFNRQKLDSADIKVLKALSEGGARKTVKELSEQTGLSIDIAWQRKKKLIKNGYFMHFFVQPGDSILGLNITYVFLKTKDKLKEIPKRCVVSFETSSGYIFGLITSNHSDYLNALDSLFTQFQGSTTKSTLLTVKIPLLLNRYPFEFLLE